MKRYWYSGIAAVFVYICAVIIGGMLYPGYSHISQDVSQLTSSDSPISDVMRIFFFYNLLIIGFGIGLYRLSKKRIAHIASLCVVTIGILGLIIGCFPIDTRGAELSSTGMIHIGLVSLISLLTVISSFMFWFAFRRSEFKRFARFSLVTGVLFLVFGPVAAVNVMSTYAGLFERIPIGIFLFWVLGTATYMLHNQTLSHVSKV